MNDSIIIARTWWLISYQRQLSIACLISRWFDNSDSWNDIRRYCARQARTWIVQREQGWHVWDGRVGNRSEFNLTLQEDRFSPEETRCCIACARVYLYAFDAFEMHSAQLWLNIYIYIFFYVIASRHLMIVKIIFFMCRGSFVIKFRLNWNSYHLSTVKYFFCACNVNGNFNYISWYKMLFV